MHRRKCVGSPDSRLPPVVYAGPAMTQGKRRSRKAQVVRLTFLGVTLGFLVAVAVLAAYIVLISTVSSTAMTVIASFLIWAIGSLQSQIHDLAEGAETVFQKWFFTMFYWIMPPLENFDFRHEVSNFMQVSYRAGINAAGEGILYIIIVLIVASIFFNDRQM